MDIPLLDAVDIEILMHRDAHFGGNFDIMLEYYEGEGVGAMPDFEVERIRELKEIQNDLGENLSAKILPMPVLEQIKEAQGLYKKFREVYESKGNHISVLISDLILAEEEHPKKVIREIVANGNEALSPLLHIIDGRQFYDPLFPGYGRAPMLAAECLAKIGDPKAIPHLFQAIGHENFSIDEAFIKALVSFGDNAKNFLFKRLQHTPISKENEHAAIVLTSFPPDEEIAKLSLSMLLNSLIFKHENFSTYLVLACEGLKKQSDRQLFFDLTKKDSTPKSLKNEITSIAKTWL
jgi:hypothetical protein